jgi:outer membrane immunogenic protein
VYIGGQIGYAWGNQTTTVFFPGGVRGFGTANDGVIGGAHVGYNVQFNQFVVGLEGSVDGSSLSRNVSGTVFVPTIGTTPVNVSSNVGIQGSIRGRLGYAFDRVLIYATGGVAFAGVDGSISTPFGYTSISNTRVGYTVGGGLEYAVTNNWSIRAEYRYSNFGTSSNNAANSWRIAGLGFTPYTSVSRRVNENQVQVGFSYKFDTFAPAGPVVAKY